MSKERVVITGLGLVSPVGLSVEESFQHMLKGVNGIDFITLYDTSNWRVTIAGEVKGIHFEDYLDKKEAKRNDRVTNLALVAAQEAWAQSGMEGVVLDPYRFGTFVGSGIGGLNTIFEETKTSVTRDPSRISPYFIPNAIINMVGAKLGMIYQAKGPNLPQVTACSAATNSLGEAYRYIKDGYLDVVMAGGSESPINEIGVGGFASLRALEPSNDPKRASRPFDLTRNGFVIAEGAGIFIMESYTHAKNRGAKILAEIVGYGTTADAFHITAPDDEAKGITRALTDAIKDAGIKPEDISYINAHGTSTTLNDKLETLGIKNAFGKHAYDLNISSTKSMTGHALGASGAIESVAVIKALETSMIPPTINYETPDPDCDLNYTVNKAVKRDMTYAININVGFGGQNAAIIFKRGEFE